MLVSAIIHFFELIVSLIPFDVPAFPTDVSSIIDKFSDILSSSLSVIKSILPWNYFVILLRIVLSKVFSAYAQHLHIRATVLVLFQFPF